MSNLIAEATPTGVVIREEQPDDVVYVAKTDEMVNAERDRRINLGTTVDVQGYGPIPVQGRAVDTTNLQGLAFAAQLAIAQGDPTRLTAFRSADDVVHMLTQPQILDLWSKGAMWVSSVFQSAWFLKDNPNGIPDDFREDAYWPT